VAFGALYSAAGYDAAWLAMAACTVLAAVVMWLAARESGRALGRQARPDTPNPPF
jgi:hypothetical protein